jgi:hypothetical protein
MVPFQESGGGVSTCVWKWVFGNPVAYYVFLMAATVFMAPLLGLAGGLTSWRAAIKVNKKRGKIKRKHINKHTERNRNQKKSMTWIFLNL